MFLQYGIFLDCFRLRLRNDGCGIATSLRHCEPQSGEAIQKY
jgi:hypothetical protein